MKNLSPVLTALTLMFVCLFLLPTEAQAATEGPLTYIISEENAIITDCNEYTNGTLSIPAVIGGFPVTAIADNAFEHCTRLTSVSIPDSISSIGNYSFNGCTLLHFVALPESVISIGVGAFKSCSSLTSITIPNGIINIGIETFANCSYLNSITIPNSVAHIGLNAFTQCYSLNVVYYGGSKQQWKVITVDNGNKSLSDATVYCAINCDNGHHWDSGAISTPASCKEPGVATFTCTECNATKTKPIAKLTTHTYDSPCDAACNICGATRKAPHQYASTWSKDQSGHWRTCNLCGNKAEQSAHTPGAAATETAAQTCTKCGFVIQTALGHTHSYQTDWSKDASGHWHACACGGQKDYADHNYKNSCDTDCDACGFTRTATHAPGPAATVAKDQTCTVCGKVLAKATGETTPPPATESTTPPDSRPAEPETQPSEPVTEPTTQPCTEPITNATPPENPPIIPSEPADDSKPYADHIVWIIVATAIVVLIIGTTIGIIIRKKKH